MLFDNGGWWLVTHVSGLKDLKRGFWLLQNEMMSGGTWLIQLIHMHELATWYLNHGIGIVQGPRQGSDMRALGSSCSHMAPVGSKMLQPDFLTHLKRRLHIHTLNFLLHSIHKLKISVHTVCNPGKNNI